MNRSNAGGPDDESAAVARMKSSSSPAGADAEPHPDSRIGTAHMSTAVEARSQREDSSDDAPPLAVVGGTSAVAPRPAVTGGVPDGATWPAVTDGVRPEAARPAVAGGARDRARRAVVAEVVADPTGGARAGADVRLSSGDIVRTADLTKRYGDHTAVDAVSMTVRRGEIYGFLGPNGAGKTTTLRMLVGLITPTSGSATVLGHHPGEPESLRRIGVLIEGPGFYPYLSGRDNLRVLARYRRGGGEYVAGSGRRNRFAEVDEVLARVGLTDRADDRFRTYSLGMKQRLGVGAALLGRPDLLILDEPTNGLDPAGMAEMRELITGLAADGHTVVLSSHLLSEVQEICDRVGVISGGRLLTESTVSQLRGAATLLVRAEPMEKAYPAVRRVVGDHAATLTAAGIRVDAGRAMAPEVARAVVESRSDLLELRIDEKSLEEVFFEMTKQESPK